MKRLYLVDVSSMFFRAFYAIPPLRTSKGLPTNALYGFLSMSIKLMRENRPDYMVYCFDRKEPSFRHEMYDEYKANRTEMPEDLEPQIPYIRELTEELGIPSIDKISFEADDVIGTLALRAAAENIEVSIVSGDKDFAQLVNGKISMYDTMKNIRYDHAGVIEKWGVEPEQIIDYLAIVGDSSDNIPGVKGVGPKGAQKLLAEYKTLENIYKHIDDIKSESLRTKLLTSKKEAFLAKKLVTIVTDVPLELKFEDMKLKPIDEVKLKALLEELEFDAFSRKLFANPEQQDSSNPNVEVSTKRSGGHHTKKTVDSNSKSSTSHHTSSDIAVSSQNFENVQWTLAELKKNIKPYEEIWAAQNERGFCLGYQGKAIQVDGTLKEIGEVLSPKLLRWQGYDVKAIWSNLSMDQTVTPIWDTMLAAYVVKAGNIDSFSDVCEKYLHKKLPELAAVEDILRLDMDLKSVLYKKLEDNRGLSVLEKFELPVVPVLYSMERKGILLDQKILQKQSHGLGVELKNIESEIFKSAGESFNIASPKQLGAVLFEKMKIPVVKKTKTGYSTENQVLEKLAPNYPICNLIIEYRELAKIKSTYVDALPTLVDRTDGRLHTHFQQAVTQTGRLSSVNPNLQNIPIRTARGREVRRAFVAQPGCVLLSVDYSQVELRVLAEITGDEGLTQAFKHNLDIHAATAAEIFEVKLHDVTDDQRRMAKAVNFGIAYGQGIHGLSETLQVSHEDAKRIIESYFSKFKKVKEYMFDIVQVAKKQGYVETLFGRRRYIDEFKSTKSMVQKFGERAAINAPIQGTASDLMKKAMIDVYENSPLQILLQVHDELLFECPEDQLESESQNIKQLMETAVDFDVPLRVDISHGPNWADLKS